jgi:hypothetical protein
VNITIGLVWKVAAATVYKIGKYLNCFPTVGHLALWAGVAPDKHEITRKRQVSKALKEILHRFYFFD